MGENGHITTARLTRLCIQRQPGKPWSDRATQRRDGNILCNFLRRACHRMCAVGTASRITLYLLRGRKQILSVVFRSNMQPHAPFGYVCRCCFVHQTHAMPHRCLASSIVATRPNIASSPRRDRQTTHCKTVTPPPRVCNRSRLQLG